MRIEMRGIDKSFGSNQVLKQAGFTLESGEVHALMGENGAGKSTMFNAICGDFLTDSGSVVLDGEDITFLPQHARAKNIGRLYQDPMRGTAPGMTILENLALAAGQGGWLSRISKSDKQRFREQLALLDIGLEDRMNHPVGLLSGGQRQALTLLMATMNPPKLLLLDEPFSALDYQTRLNVCDDVYRIIKSEKKTAVLITHDISEAVSVADEAIVLSRRPATLVAEYALPFGEETPLKRRENPAFSLWFERLWKDLNV